MTSNQIKEISPDSSTRVDALKHGGPTIRVCGCCGTEHDISKRSSCPVVRAVKRITGKKFAAHPSLTQRESQAVVVKGVVVKGIPKPPKVKQPPW